MKPLRMKYAARATTTLACDDDAMLSLVRYGEDTDRAAILCHGFIQNASAWSVPRHSFIDFLVERGLTVYALELRGRVCDRGLVCDGGSSLLPICMQDLKIIRVTRAIPPLGSHHGTRRNHAADQMVRAIILAQVARGRW
jgi:hypothetical protein